MHDYNQAVLRHLKLMVLITVIGGSLLREYSDALGVAGRTRYYRDAIEALKNNRLDLATRLLTEDDHSLYAELLAKGHWRAAAHLRTAWPKAVREALGGR